MSKVLFSDKDGSLLTVVPHIQLAEKSLQIISPQQRFRDWSKKNHADSYIFMQKIAQIWKDSHFTTQYLIYGKIDSHVFKWEIIPYQKCSNFFNRMIQQLKILWRTIFGGLIVSGEKRKEQYEDYQKLVQKTVIPTPVEIVSKGNDAFCKSATLDRQWVITGNKVNVLFNYAPIGFGGEKLHFLVVPKEHRESFNDVTKEEYSETMELTTKLVNHFTETRKTIKNVYLLNKSGKDAGQTVNHWHLHVIFSMNAAQDFWGKLTVMKNILFGSSPIKNEDLVKKISAFREELVVQN